MKKKAFLSCPLLAVAFLPLHDAWAQPTAEDTLRVLTSNINVESENAELCLAFDKPLATTSPAHLAAALRLEEDGKSTVPQNIAATASSLCLFPLDRDHPYRLTLNGLRGAQGEKLAAPYSLTFTVPDRSPLLAFTGINGGANGFGAYESPITLRAVNVLQGQLEVYRVTDVAAMGRIWQDRAQTSLAPSESAYLARNRGQLAWETAVHFNAPPNATAEQSITLRDKLPDLTPGLYLIIASEGEKGSSTSSKGLAPLAAAWFTKSDFTLRAVSDNDGVHVFASSASAAKGNVRLIALDKKTEQVAETRVALDGIGLLPVSTKTGGVSTIIAIDDVGNIAFADVEPLPTLAALPTLGSLAVDDPFTAPGNTVGVSLSLAGATAGNATPSLLRVLRDGSSYAAIPVPPLAKNTAKISFPAPAIEDTWNLHWQKKDGTVLAETFLPVTANADAPHLNMTTDVAELNGQASPDVDLSSQTSIGKAAPLIGGHLMLAWQLRDPAAAGWQDYHFGTQAAIVNAPLQSDDFLTDLQGTTHIHLHLPKPPPDPGLYQTALTAVADTDQGVAPTPPLYLPLRPDGTVIGIKSLSPYAHFTQNGLARFALIGLSSDEKPRDVSGLSYQIYEEGRSFDWYQDEGKWSYKRNPQLRPIGGGTLAIKADGSSVLEWPVDAGNYRLEILDLAGKVLAQLPFSAGWDSVNAIARSSPLPLTLAKTLHPGHETVARFTLPTPAMVTAIIADAHIRKTIHEFRPKGENTIAFTPAEDWQNGVSLTIEATAALPDQAPLSMRAVAQSVLTHNEKPVGNDSEGGASLFSPSPSFTLREGEESTLNLGLGNRGHAPETYSYAFTASPGLKIEGDSSGHLTLGERQNRALPLSLTGAQAGVKELKVEINGAHVPPITRIWQIAVLPPHDFLMSSEAAALLPQQSLNSPNVRPHNTKDSTIAFIARRPMEGLGETLSYVFTAHPFATEELALGVDALRLWQDTLAQTGLAPDFAVAARWQEWLTQLLQHQNPDGGFSRLRGGDSTMEDTATALLALGPDASDKVHPAKDLAIAWLQQRLANTWFDEKERAVRAAAYAGLAAANALDPASLHYFSDTSATAALPAVAEANIAAAFKRLHDPNAAAFWIKKLLDENGQSRTIPLLNALAATDALSSDDVHSVMRDMAESLRHGNAPAFADAAALLRATASDNANAGTWPLTVGSQTHDVSGVYAVHLADTTAASLRNGSAEPLTISFASEAQMPSINPPQDASITRHIYRLNGVELAPQTKPAHGEIYIVELTGKTPTIQSGEKIILQDSAGTALRPVGCMLSARLDTLSFIPWFTPHDLTPLSSCEKGPHEINGVLASSENESADFRAVYFARIDAKTTGGLMPPQIRIIKR